MRLPRINPLPWTVVRIPCGFEAVADLETARLRLCQLAAADPGDYFVFDLGSKQVLFGLLTITSPLPRGDSLP
jgi:hypothetical protein